MNRETSRGKPRAHSDPAEKPKWARGDLIGKGAYGHVYLGLNLSNGKLIAIKSVFVRTRK